MFGTPASRARRRNRRIIATGPADYDLVAHMIGAAILADPFPVVVLIEAHMIGAGIMADGFSVVRNTSYANPGGTGDRTALIDVFFDQAIGGGATRFLDITNAVDGATGNNTSDSWFFSAGAAPAELFIDFRPSGFFQVIDEFKWYQDNSTAHGTWKVEGFDGFDWFVLLSSFTLGGSTTQTVTLTTNIGEYMFYRLVHTGGASRSSSPWLKEIEFKIAQGEPIPVYGATYATEFSVGDRTSLITVTSNATFSPAGSPSLLVNGVKTAVADLAFTSQSGKEIKFDFSAWGTVRIEEFKWYQSNNGGHSFWRWYGSDDDITYHAMGNWFELFGPGGGGSITYDQMRSIQRTFPYYKMLHMGVSDVSASPFLWEIEFKCSTDETFHQIQANMVGRGIWDTESVVVGDDPVTFWETGDRRSTITVTTNYPAPAVTSLFVQEFISGAQLATAPDMLVNGNNTGENKTFRGGHTDAYLKFDFGTGRIVNGFRWYQKYYPTSGGDGNHGVFQWHGSNDDASYTALGNSFDLKSVPGDVHEYSEPNGNITSYRYYKLIQASGTTKKSDNALTLNSIYVSEIEFKIDPP